MDIRFKTKKLKKQMEDERSMQRAYGDLAKTLQRRLRTLAEAPALADVPGRPPDRCHLLTGGYAGQFAVMLSGNWRLIFEPDHDPAPLRPDGGLDLTAVTAIRILEVADYH